MQVNRTISERQVVPNKQRPHTQKERIFQKEKNILTIMSEQPSILVLISGNGSNLQALIESSAKGELPAKITHVISSSSKAYGLERSAKAGIPTTTHELKTYYKGIPKEEKEKRIEARKLFNKDLVKLILAEDKKPDMIVCAGWMLILSADFLAPLAEANIPIINLHPALPGKFEGTCAIERSWKAGQDGEVKTGGVMIHYVIEEVDMGEPLVVCEIDVKKGEELESWEKRIHELEHGAIVEGAKKVVEELNKKKEEENSDQVEEKEQDSLVSGVNKLSL